MVGACGFEPQTSSVSGKRSNQLSYAPIFVTPGLPPADLPEASGRCNQLSYAPIFSVPGLLPLTTGDLPDPSGRSNQLRYAPIFSASGRILIFNQRSSPFAATLPPDKLRDGQTTSFRASEAQKC